MEKPKQLAILIANFPGLIINVPARDNEPIQYIMDRVTNKLSEQKLATHCHHAYTLMGK